VAFFTRQRPVPGRADISAEYQGALYRFSSEEHRALFEQDPVKYAPAFGGYCAYAVSQGGIAPVDVTTFQLIEGRLVLNKNPEVLELFNRERDERYRKATANWPEIVERRGK
jgi:YHS domain-containing protein